MKLLLLVGAEGECGLCEVAKARFTKQYGTEIAKLEAEVRDLDNDEQMQELWMSHDDIPLAPVVLLVTDDYKKIISQIEVADLLEDIKQAEPAPAQASG